LPNWSRSREDFRKNVAAFIDDLVSHYTFWTDGKLVVAHAGMKETCRGAAPGRFAILHSTARHRRTDEFGLPIRYNWAAEYRGKGMVCTGTRQFPNLNGSTGTINIDTGCVFERAS